MKFVKLKMWTEVWSRSPRSPVFGQELELDCWKECPAPGLSALSGLLGNLLQFFWTFVQFILQLKLCLYTIVHLLLEEFKIFLVSSLCTQSLC